MWTIEIWKLMTDVLLAGGLVYLGWRLMSSGRLTQASSRLNQLEIELKRMVSHAEESGRSLNDQLLKRQQELEKLLSDIGSAEYRVNKAIGSAEENKSSLLGERERLERIINQAREIAPGSQSTKAPAVQNATHAKSAEIEPSYNANLYADESPEPPSFSSEAAPRALVASSARSSATQLNIYGEPVGSNEIAPGLSSKVERQVMTQSQAAPQLTLEQIYRAAGEMLRAGEDLQIVARKTNLGMPELRRIAHALAQQARAKASSRETTIELEVEQEQKPQPASAADPRLGVLGGIKRQVQVL